MGKIAAVILLLITCHTLQAQTWELGISGGGTGYMGDLNQRNLLSLSGVSAGFLVQRNFNPYLSVRVGYTYGDISAADSASNDAQIRGRNLSFNTKLNELSLIAQFNFLRFTPSADENSFTPYIYLGIAAVGYTPTAIYKGQTYDLRTLTTEGQTKPYLSTAMAIPYGFGLKYNFSGKWNISADIGYRNPNTDYLDDVSGYYAAKNKFSSPVAAALSDRSGERGGVYTGAAGTQRGDLRARDTYLFVNFTLSFTFCY